MTNQEQYEKMCNLYEMTVRKMTNKEWCDFLAQQFDVSRTTARNMLHGLMKMKKHDNANKLFQGNKQRNTKFDVEVWKG